MRLALLSDIHGNPIALNAVLADVAAQGGVDSYWVLGDLAALGYDPVAVIERLVELPNVRFVRGNTDRYVATDDLPSPRPEDVRRDPSMLSRLVEVAQSFAWTRGYVTAAGWRSWLGDLPLEQRVILPDGTRLLGVHAAPGLDDGPGIRPEMSDAEIEALVAAAEADLICVGHTHVPLDRSVGGVRVANLGSVSLPVTEDRRASYVLLEADASGHHLEWRRVAYDWESAIAATERVRHPARGFIISHLRGVFK